MGNGISCFSSFCADTSTSTSTSGQVDNSTQDNATGGDISLAGNVTGIQQVTKSEDEYAEYGYLRDTGLAPGFYKDDSDEYVSKEPEMRGYKPPSDNEDVYAEYNFNNSKPDQHNTTEDVYAEYNFNNSKHDQHTTTEGNSKKQVKTRTENHLRRNERNFVNAKKGQNERNHMGAKERKAALSATPNPYRETSEKLVQYQGHFALNLGVFSPFRAALRCAFRALSSFAES